MFTSETPACGQGTTIVGLAGKIGQDSTLILLTKALKDHPPILAALLAHVLVNNLKIRPYFDRGSQNARPKSWIRVFQIADIHRCSRPRGLMDVHFSVGKFRPVQVRASQR